MRSLTATIVVLAATLTSVQSALMIRHVFRPKPVEIPEEKSDPFNFDGLPPAFQTTGFPMIWPIIGSGLSLDPKGMKKTMNWFKGRGVLYQMMKPNQKLRLYQRLYK